MFGMFVPNIRSRRPRSIAPMVKGVVRSLGLGAAVLLAALNADSAKAFVPPLHRTSGRASVLVMSSIGPSPAPGGSVTLTVKGPDGKVLTTTKAQVGANLRKTLQGAKVDVYDLVGKLTNCNGGGQCLTCTVRLDVGGWGPRSEYEDSKLPPKGWKDGKYRLACQTLIGPTDATLTVRPNKPGK